MSKTFRKDSFSKDKISNQEKKAKKQDIKNRLRHLDIEDEDILLQDEELKKNSLREN